MIATAKNTQKDPLQTCVGVYKERTHKTHHEEHLPLLHSASSRNRFSVALIGDSMFERFKTTGQATRVNQTDSIINLGVGGDQIKHLLYRFEQGLLQALQSQSTLAKIYLHIGTNNLNKKGLSEKDLKEYAFALKWMQESFPRVRIFATGLFPRTTHKEEVIHSANVALEEIAKGGSIEWIPAPAVILDKDLEDHTHLNELGYTK